MIRRLTDTPHAKNMPVYIKLRIRPNARPETLPCERNIEVILHVYAIKTSTVRTTANFKVRFEMLYNIAVLLDTSIYFMIQSYYVWLII